MRQSTPEIYTFNLNAYVTGCVTFYHSIDAPFPDPTDYNVITITNKDGDQNYERKKKVQVVEIKRTERVTLVSVSPKLLGMKWIEKWRRTSRIILTPAVFAVSGKTSVWATRVERWPSCLGAGWQEAVENTMCVFVCVWGGWSVWSGAGKQ